MDNHVAPHPRVSIILTFFNNVEYVRPAMESIARQTFIDYELIVTDDGSKDGTKEAIAELIGTFDRARFLDSDINRGIARTRNAAVEAAQGEYIWFVDCDDQWTDQILEALVDAAVSTSADIAVCRAVRTESRDSDLTFPLDGRDDAATLDRIDAIRGMVLGTIRGYLWNKLIRRELLAEHPFPAFSSLSDLAGMTFFVEHCQRVTFVPELHYWHLVRSGSITNSRSPELGNIRYCWERITQVALASGAYAEGAPELVYLTYWQYYSAVVNTYYRVGSDSKEADEMQREVRSRVTVSDLRTVARFDRRLAAVVGLMRFGGSMYPRIYHAYLRRRSKSENRAQATANA